MSSKQAKKISESTFVSNTKEFSKFEEEQKKTSVNFPESKTEIKAEKDSKPDSKKPYIILPKTGKRKRRREESIEATSRRRKIEWEQRKKEIMFDLVQQKSVLKKQYLHRKNAKRKRKEINKKVDTMKMQIEMMKRKLSLTKADINFKRKQILEKNQVDQKKRAHSLALIRNKKQREKERKLQTLTNRRRNLSSKQNIFNKKLKMLNFKKSLVQEQKSFFKKLINSTGNMNKQALKRCKINAERVRKLKRESRIKRLNHVENLYSVTSNRINREIKKEEGKIKTDRDIARKYLKEEIRLEKEFEGLKTERKAVDNQWENIGDVIVKRRKDAIIDKEFKPMRMSPDKMDIFLDYKDLNMSDDSFERKEKMRLKEFKFRILKKRCKTIKPQHLKFEQK